MPTIEFETLWETTSLAILLLMPVVTTNYRPSVMILIKFPRQF